MASDSGSLAAQTGASPPASTPPLTLTSQSSPTGPFVLRPLLHDVPLSEDGSNGDIKINCVEYSDGNLYVGTTASELLHFFRIPPDANDPSSTDTFILASRLCPPFSQASSSPNGSRPGVQQILLLPRVGKACVLCNWTVTFYSLPELSPVFGTTQVRNCNWIGGVDLNENPYEAADDRPDGVTILLSLNRRIQVAQIGDVARPVKKIDFAGSTLSVRRDTIACVADSSSYALLDVDRQQKIPLMSISSLDESQPGGAFGQAQNISGGTDGGLLRSASSATTRPSGLSDAQGHARSTSLGGFISGGIRRHDRQEAEDPVFQDSDAPQPSRSPAPTDKPLPVPPQEAGLSTGAHASGSNTPGTNVSPSKPGPVFLKPHIVSPTAEEFLLVTGTGPLEPGIGMFVNLDGDPTRPTLEFERYPREIAVDGGAPDLSTSGPTMGMGMEEGYVLASMAREFEDGLHHGLEIQRFDVNVGEGEAEKFWLELTGAKEGAKLMPNTPVGIRSMLQGEEMQVGDVVDRLCQRRFSPFPGSPETPTRSLRSADSRTALSMERLSQEKELFERDLESDEDPLPAGWESKRNKEGEDFVRSLAKTTSRLAVWAGADIWWAVRNSLLSQLESSLSLATAQDQQSSEHKLAARKPLFAVLDNIRGRDPRTELEFMTLGYIRQRASLMLLGKFLDPSEPPFTETETQIMEENLVEADLDARVVLSLIPALRNEIVVDRKGIWVYGGVKTLAESYISAEDEGPSTQTVGSLPPAVLHFLRRFLSSWRKKKGFGSISGEIFRTVDASLLLVLLELDQSTPRGQQGKTTGTVRKELWDLVDHGVDCFDRAVDLLEDYQRLYVLSRLYQHRKMAADVLATWRRIVEGEEDRGGEFGDGEQQVKAYLAKIGNHSLVQEYGVWLATRNPKLGVQVFSDDRGKAKFEPAQVVELLRDEAPEAVKYYLEHLVFGKGNTAYVNDLITYYLDIVIENLQSSPASRETVTASYEAYRALHSPKPKYHHFLRDNAPPDDEVWQSRLRLLQLLGGDHDYDASAIRERINSTLSSVSNTATNGHGEQQLLVPEAIIINGRERRHEEALSLLVHRLGDYDMAVTYCLRGGPSLSFAPGSGPRRQNSLPTRELQTRLFRVLLSEFMRLEDISDRVEQSGALLERFGGWFDVLEVLEIIPDSWSVDVAAGFLMAALRRLAVERHESMMAKSLSIGENLRVRYDLIVKAEEKGPVVEE
ncbi:hypothetical protein QBC37DRAFT_418089 [Rhypophila decipiens]|uniref:CNH domain-containing protein n=1 Tax=Rhypophila decipiens TaxID=261697 RepID=A0AAN6YD96_9PEZI|nr:hypothetical protein QBC37DRAFT_418089 [Rhypophila decipiens]